MSIKPPLGDSSQINLRIPTPLLEAIMKRAVHEGRTMSNLVRKIITDALADNSKEGI